ncbi:iron-sulfur cluster assembly scaffold protein [Metamycoplasma equirhinis]|uniref:iron-sulfur cluster assembly scaffold protein n=1 Tax=Metamycoplasma equirhinis TaxID=92402 RepID=UPI0035937BC2
MIFYNPNEIREIIFSAYLNPKFKIEELPHNNKTIFEHSNVCVDTIELNLEFNDNVLIDAKYKAEGCTIFIASIELMLDNILNKDRIEIKKIIDAYFAMINNNNLNDNDFDLLNKLIVFKNVKNSFNRLECASIIYRAISKGI